MTETFPSSAPPVFPIDRDTGFREERVTMGDGYIQAFRKNLNYFSEIWRPQWTDLSQQDRDEILNFLADRAKDGMPFWWTPPGQPQQMFRVRQWNPRLASNGRSTLALEFERVFEPSGLPILGRAQYVGGPTEAMAQVYLSDYKTNVNSWTDALTLALNDENAVSDTIYVEPGTYIFTDEVICEYPGKKLQALSNFASDTKFRFDFPDSAEYANKSGIWFRNKARVAGISFTSTTFTKAREQNLLRFERLPQNNIGSSDEGDMDSSVTNCNFSSAKEALSKDPRWGNAIVYVGRNIEVNDCNFSDMNGTCVSLSMNPNPTGPDTNPFQLPFMGHRKPRISGNLAHIGQGARFIHLHGSVAIRGLQVIGNTMDIGGQFLYSEGTGGIRGGIFLGNTCLNQEDNDEDRSPIVYLKSGAFDDVEFTACLFGGSDGVNGITGAGGGIGGDNRRPQHVLRVGSAADVESLSFFGGAMIFSAEHLVKIDGDISGFSINGTKLAFPNRSGAANGGAIFAGTNMQNSIITNVRYGSDGGNVFIDWNGQTGSNVKVRDNIILSDGSFQRQGGNLDSSVLVEQT